MPRAAALFVEAFAGWTARGDPWLAAWTLAGLVGVVDVPLTGDWPTLAARLAGAVEVRREAAGAALQPVVAARFARAAATAREALGEVAFAAERDAGRLLTPEQVLAEATALSAALASGSPRPTSAPSGDEGRSSLNLSPREREVLRLIAAGRSNAEIAEALFISRRTVTTHAAHILNKLGLASRAELIAYAHRRGLA